MKIPVLYVFMKRFVTYSVIYSFAKIWLNVFENNYHYSLEVKLSYIIIEEFCLESSEVVELVVFVLFHQGQVLFLSLVPERLKILLVIQQEAGWCSGK